MLWAIAYALIAAEVAARATRWKRVTARFLSLVVLAGVAAFLWFKLPRPTEPVTLQDLKDAFAKQNDATSKQSSPPASSPPVEAKKALTAEDIVKILAKLPQPTDDLRATVPGLIDSMQTWARKWDDDDRAAENRMEGVPNNTPDRERIVQALIKNRAALNVQYTKDIIPLLTSLDYVRKKLLQGTELNDFDRWAAEKFQKVLDGEQTLDWQSMSSPTGYMSNLARKTFPEVPAYERAIGPGT